MKWNQTENKLSYNNEDCVRKKYLLHPSKVKKKTFFSFVRPHNPKLYRLIQPTFLFLVDGSLLSYFVSQTYWPTYKIGQFSYSIIWFCNISTDDLFTTQGGHKQVALLSPCWCSFLKFPPGRWVSSSVLLLGGCSRDHGRVGELGGVAVNVHLFK